MVLNAEHKKALFDLMQECTTLDDISYVNQLKELRRREIEASQPKGMQPTKGWSFGFGR